MKYLNQSGEVIYSITRNAFSEDQMGLLYLTLKHALFSIPAVHLHPFARYDLTDQEMHMRYDLLKHLTADLPSEKKSQSMLSGQKI